jgi:hypothetical protein
MSVQRLEVLRPIAGSEFLESEKDFFESARYCATRILGCWHIKMSRPFTHGTETYRECLWCGMHRRFDVRAWKSTGRFYPASIGRR